MFPPGSDYYVGEYLGSGARGQIYVGTHTSGRVVTIKIMKDPDAARMEIAALVAVKDLPPTCHIPRYVDSFLVHVGNKAVVGTGDHDKTTETHIITEYIPGEDLISYDYENTPDASRFYWELTKQILTTLAELHRAGVAHRDVKPDNILIGPGLVFTLIDFDAACPNVGDRITGTYGYWSPRIVKRISRGQRPNLREYQLCDVFALGVVLYQFSESGEPFATTDNHYRWHDFTKPRGFRAETPLADLIRLMLTGRATAEQCLAHPYVSQTHAPTGP